MQIEKIKELFLKEFEPHKEKFNIYELTLKNAKESKDEKLCRPGVYVFWHPNRNVIKVGRHIVNSRKRALEHIRDNTGKKMNGLDDDTRIVLFNLNRNSVSQPYEDLHWVFALEVFFELKLAPEIPSKRLG